ncbi:MULTISPECIES: hypothetical protein [Acinetobacter]|uniref:Lipoprotein n=2 Tax=Acinetobacter TaxID=469 RepID=N8VIL3_9GAMM|nr:MULTISPECIES: hypothetical protein [Acinetobacter]ENU99796.1 hypothetical protein F969_01158 [Acinetobacter variabilis]MDM1269256.1 hypothetical protein [Acinetobacter indicus]
MKNIVFLLIFSLIACTPHKEMTKLEFDHELTKLEFEIDKLGETLSSELDGYREYYSYVEDENFQKIRSEREKQIQAQVLAEKKTALTKKQDEYICKRKAMHLEAKDLIEKNPNLWDAKTQEKLDYHSVAAYTLDEYDKCQY